MVLGRAPDGRGGLTMAPRMGWTFREMTEADLDAVAAVLSHVESEDAEEALEAMREDLSDRFVLVHGDRVDGVTGFREIPDTDRSYWLSYTGLEPGEATGDDLIPPLLDRLRAACARKLFVMLGDADAAPGSIRRSGGAREFYEKLGFSVEARHANYYDRSEAAIVMGIRLAGSARPAGKIPDPGRIRIVDSDEIDETDDAYYVDWEFAGEDPESSPREFEDWIGSLREWEARVAFLGLPSDAKAAAAQVLEAGFTEDGRLTDFIEDGVHENRFRYDLL